MNINSELGVQSYCFRGFKSNEQVAQLTRKLGLSVIELCGGVHVDLDDVMSFDRVIDVYRQAKVRISSIYVGDLNNDAAAMRNRFEFARRAGANVISATFGVDSVPKSYRAAERMAEKYDINVAIHNHGGHDWLGNSQMLRHVFKNTGPRLGLCLDTAWALDARQDPIAMAEEFGERLYGVHIKDFVFDRAGKPRDVVVGTGNLDLKNFLATLRKLRFRGSLILEYEGDVDNPLPALKKCVKAVQKENRI